MIITVKGKNLTIDDKMASIMKKNYMDVDELTCESYVEIYYTDKTTTPPTIPDIDELFATKSEEELSHAVNELLKGDMELIKH